MFTQKTNEINARRDCNVLAAFLSLIPGLGHIYKGHLGGGLAILLLGVPMGIWIAVMQSAETEGVGMLLLYCAWGIVALDAYGETDLISSPQESAERRNG